MPKKFKGENTKAVEARNRKAAVDAEKNAVARQAAEEDAWRDDDKLTNKKAQRKNAEEEKRKAAVERKKLAAQLLVEEEAAIEAASSGKTPAKKLTQAELSLRKAEQERENEEAQQEKEDPIPENLNHVMTDVEVAQSVEQAIEALDIADGVDMHPEKRVKAAWNAFEQGRISQLRAENPSLRLSQVRQMLRKEWQKSPLNPMNQ
ncbi:coiled-coil domain-containing protein 124-like [Bolinopsis microptera]|uniref:coiled-coil domain-containing protein 124-like n=1 Tax=Bolinopsis microptera TaxID=2820187 RepID=UPI00307A8D1D